MHDFGEQQWEAVDVGEEIGTWSVFDKTGLINDKCFSSPTTIRNRR
jgi:hypothetical protein